MFFLILAIVILLAISAFLFYKNNKKEVLLKEEKKEVEETNDEDDEREKFGEGKKNEDEKGEGEEDEEEKEKEGEVEIDKGKRDESQKKRKIEPIKRGGRSREKTEDDSGLIIEKERHSLQRPEFICKKIEMEWFVGIEFPEDFNMEEVRQGDEILENDSSNENLYFLKNFKEKINFSYKQEGIDINNSIVFGQKEDKENCFIFKMKKSWTGEGRLIKYTSVGYYIIIVPENWTHPITEISPIEPELTDIDGYKVYFCNPKENTPITFTNKEKGQVKLESKCSLFELEGKEIIDFSEYIGPFFAEEPPKIKIKGDYFWNDVGVIVIGEEGSKRNRWRTSFKPDEGNTTQEMPTELKERKGGWFFVRIYDKKHFLIESMDFRFLSKMKNIIIEKSPVLPILQGYSDVNLIFEHQKGCKIRANEDTVNFNLEIVREESLTTVKIPPHVDYDKTEWIVKENEIEVTITILIERFWWQVGITNESPSSWEDKPIKRYRSDFTATTNQCLWLKTPPTNNLDKINVGFSYNKASYYNINSEDHMLSIPLREFSDDDEITSSSEASSITLFTKNKKNILINVNTLFQCTKCDFKTTSEKKALNHIEKHLSLFVPHLTYKELCEWMGEEPSEIYKCGYCPYYIPVKEYESALTKMLEHLSSNDCSERDSILRNDKLEIIDNIDEIRENFNTSLPHVYRCKFCDETFTGNNKIERLNHLKEKHKKEIFSI